MFYPEEFTQRLKQPEDRHTVLEVLIASGRVVLSSDVDGTSSTS